MTDYEIQENFKNCKPRSTLLYMYCWKSELVFQNAIICFNMWRNKVQFELHLQGPEGF